MDFYSNLDSRSLDRNTPTLFEVISAKELENLLSPSIRFVLVHYANKYPRYLIRILNRFDELNLAIRGLVEYSFLHNWNSTFIEKFYGLKRCNQLDLTLENPVTGQLTKYETLKRLRRSQVGVSLVEVVVVPYLKEKLDLLYDSLLPEYLMQKLKPDESKKDMAKYWFLKLYPAISTVLKLLNIVFKVLYLSGKFKSTSLLQYLFGIQYSRLNQFDYRLAEQRTAAYLQGVSTEPKSSRIRPISLSESVVAAYSQVAYPLKKSLLFGSESVLPVSIFLLKFLEWWNTSDVKKNFKTDTVTERTPQVPPLLNNEVAASRSMRSRLVTKTPNCPLCHEEIHNPAVIETGYVFCYKCIYTFLREGDENAGKCPITGKRLVGCKYSQSAKEWKVTNIRRLMI
ncbi:hypothetical protein KL939_002160 [Ogataea angusta]|nr:hypothetical protein KL939_002160 [Ogataea angusta]